MGVVDNPLTQSRSVNLQQARMVIDDLAMLREKTTGNLDATEEKHLSKVIGDLEQHFSQLAGESK